MNMRLNANCQCLQKSDSQSLPLMPHFCSLKMWLHCLYPIIPPSAVRRLSVDNLQTVHSQQQWLYESDSNRVQRAVVLPDAARRPPEGSIMIRLGLRLRVWLSVPFAASYAYQEC